MLEQKNDLKINIVSLHFKKLEKEQFKPKASKRKEVIKVRRDSNETETQESSSGQGNQKLIS